MSTDHIPDVAAMVAETDPLGYLMRASFENWMSDSGRWPKAVERSQYGGYRLMSAHSAWSAWQASWVFAVDAERARQRDKVRAHIGRTTMSIYGTQAECKAARDALQRLLDDNA